jgi:hypothetical protein
MGPRSSHLFSVRDSQRPPSPRGSANDDCTERDDVQRLLNWVELGVFDAIDKQYLRALSLNIHGDLLGQMGPLLESYTFKGN